MGRMKRVVVPGLPHHITQRGNHAEDVFDLEGDRLVYLSMIRKAAERRGVRIWAYCLMTNHVHLIAVPSKKDSLSLLVKDAHTAYAAWFHKRSARTGHLWQARFRASVMDEPYLWAAVRYVERNPVRAGLVARSEDYAWSSAAAHCDIRDDLLVTRAFPIAGVVSDWKAWLADEDVAASSEVRQMTRLGLPCGNGSFIQELERVLGRPVRPNPPKPRGRRPKNQPSAKLT